MTLCINGVTVRDPVSGPVLTGVLDTTLALFESLGEQGIVPPCAAGIVAGAFAAVDRGLDVGVNGELGMLWVRLANEYPSAKFPAPDIAPVRDRDLSYAVVVEVGMLRPAPVEREIGDEVVLPSMEEEDQAAAMAVTDKAIVRQALLDYAEGADVELVMGQFTPFGPEAGVVGGAVTATIQVV